MSEYTPEMAHAAAERGAKWMDKRCRHWVAEIDINELDLRNPQMCVLGQTASCLLPSAIDCADYVDVVDHVAPVRREAWAIPLGFNVPDNNHAEDKEWEREMCARYEMLTIAWKLEIQKRLEPVS